MIFKLLFLLNNLNILPILKDLMIVVDVPTEIFVTAQISVPSNVPMTISKSNTFQLSLKYFLSKAIILMIASKVNKAANMQLIISVMKSTVGAQRYQVRAKTMVLTKINIRITWSNTGLDATKKKNRRNLLSGDFNLAIGLL